MSEYTPTTENVRQTFAYVQAGLDHDDGHPFVTHIHVEELDRWLAEVERAAAEEALLKAAEDFALPARVNAFYVDIWWAEEHAINWLRSRATEYKKAEE